MTTAEKDDDEEDDDGHTFYDTLFFSPPSPLSPDGLNSHQLSTQLMLLHKTAASTEQWFPFGYYNTAITLPVLNFLVSYQDEHQHEEKEREQHHHLLQGCRLVPWLVHYFSNV